MARRLIAVVFWIFVGEVFSQCTKCGLVGNADTGAVPTIDLIREFHLSESAEKYEVVPGSIATQHAYRLNKESNVTVHSYQAFPKGIPSHFWFESTYRVLVHPTQPWYLFHLTDSQGVSQLSITLDSVQRLIGVGLPDVMGNVQRVYFQHSNLFDRSWHKLLVSVVKDQVKVWVDCEQATGVRGELFEPLLPRRKFDTTNGFAYISQYVDEINAYVTTPEIELQWMVIGCETTRPSIPNCEELPEYQEAVGGDIPVVQPIYETTTPQQCPIQCPVGPPGRDGFNGPAGPKGERGEIGFPGESVFGQKGEKGEPGIIITRSEGESHSFGELQIREICSKVVEEQLAAVKPSLIGPVGPPGQPGRPGRMGPKGHPGEAGRMGMDGAPGRPGEVGEKGDKGDIGSYGIPGPAGQPGYDGAPGSPGRKGDRGDDGRNGSPGAPGPAGQCPNDCYYTQMYMQQLQAAQAQQQNKGPSS